MKTYHFWRREEGSTGECIRIAALDLDDGVHPLVKYHMAHQDRAEGEEFLQSSVWHWHYMGHGRIYSIDGKALL